MEKDFFNIAELTKEFEGSSERMQGGQIEKCCVRALLAIAQQLAVISGHLGRIHEELQTDRVFVKSEVARAMGELKK
jgi:hypothetical protein